MHRPHIRYVLMLIMLSMSLLINGKSLALSSVSLSYGEGEPQEVQAYQIGFQNEWPILLFKESPWHLTGFWDIVFAQLNSHGNTFHQYKRLELAALAPNFRFTRIPYPRSTLSPFIDAAIGPALLSKSRLGKRKFSTAFQFYDRFGAGFRFGEHAQYEIGGYYLHLSNARLKCPNNGIDVKWMLTLKYHIVNLL